MEFDDTSVYLADTNNLNFSISDSGEVNDCMGALREEAFLSTKSQISLGSFSCCRVM